MLPVSSVSLWFPHAFSLPHQEVPVVSVCSETHPAWGRRSYISEVHSSDFTLSLSHFPGTSRCRWCWWATRWTWRRRGRCPPARARRSPRTGAALSWRRRPRARPWWTSCSPRSWGRWTSALCRTGGRPAAPPAAYSSSPMGSAGGVMDGWMDGWGGRLEKLECKWIHVR